jgi:hypothetical protein
MRIYFLLLFFSCLTCQQILSQEKFDIINYTPPAKWTKEIKNSYVSYITVNESAGTFCLIVLYAAVPETGSPETDFAKEWEDLVVKAYGAQPNPKTETRAHPDGWKVIAGAAAIQKGNISSSIILTVFSGFDKVISVLANLNDQAYIPDIDNFLNNMKPDKTASSSNKIIPGSKNETMVNNNKPGKFGQMNYTIPPGWKLNARQGVSLSPADLPSSELLSIELLPAMSFPGNIDQALEKSYDETCAMLQASKMTEVSGKNYNAVEAKKSFRGWEYKRCSGGIQVNNGTPYPTEFGLDLFVIKINSRYERVAILNSRNTCGGLSRYYPSDRQTWANAIENFLFTLEFDDWKEPVVKNGTATGDGIFGVWTGLSMSVGLAKTGAVLGAELNQKYLILFSNGQAYFGKYFPAEGLDGLNTWIKAEKNRRDWGYYTFSNGRGVLKLPYAEIPLRLANNKLVITTNKTEHSFIKLNGVDYVKFDGNYVMSEWNGMIPAISFTNDGKFTDRGALRVLYHEYVDCLNLALTPGSGTYDVKNHSIIFNYSDGRKIKIAFTEAGFSRNNADASAVIRVSYNDDVLRKL